MHPPRSSENQPLTERFSNVFAPDVRERGKDYFLRRRVTIDTLEEDFLIASARGSSNYKIVLEIDADTLFVSCDCPFATGQEELCKHIWATLIEADDVLFGRGEPALSSMELRRPSNRQA